MSKVFSSPVDNKEETEYTVEVSHDQVRQFWEEHSKAIRQGLEDEDGFQAESIALSFTRVVGP